MNIVICMMCDSLYLILEKKENFLVFECFQIHCFSMFNVVRNWKSLNALTEPFNSTFF